MVVDGFFFIALLTRCSLLLSAKSPGTGSAGFKERYRGQDRQRPEVADAGGGCMGSVGLYWYSAYTQPVHCRERDLSQRGR
ncbi:hypothetical protein NDU88_000309 [Pleurodeles waltl]|uniref:Secreted protein n=1 Tax=Pleurodeles waltl TaxID=8319 RepID=A0AAV7WHU1_PLEWA|nr:hypothetical protein NDU88_000309 [Pleurodeles waltl]